jgi:hypothetical protein
VQVGDEQTVRHGSGAQPARGGGGGAGAG